MRALGWVGGSGPLPSLGRERPETLAGLGKPDPSERKGERKMDKKQNFLGLVVTGALLHEVFKER